jgi:serine/threonine protein kinase
MRHLVLAHKMSDLSPNNILLGVDDKDVLTRIEEAECNSRTPRKLLADRVIYTSHDMPLTHGAPVISDFGAARLGKPGQKYSGDVMPGVYRAPEIILGMQWDAKIDVWSVGLIVRESPSHRVMFPFTDPKRSGLGSVRGWPPLPYRQRWSSQ